MKEPNKRHLFKYLIILFSSSSFLQISGLLKQAKSPGNHPKELVSSLLRKKAASVATRV